MAYTKKFVNGILQNVTAGDVTKLNARDAAGWTSPSGADSGTTTAVARLARMAKAFGLTVAEFKTLMRE